MDSRGSRDEGCTFRTHASTVDDLARASDAAPTPVSTHDHGTIAEEVHGAIGVMVAVAVLAGAALAALPFANPHHPSWPLALLLCATIVIAIYVGIKARLQPWSYRHRHSLLVALSSVASSLAWIYCCDTGSAATLALVMSVFFFGISSPTRGAAAMFVVAAAGYAAIAWHMKSAPAPIGFVELCLAVAFLLSGRLRQFRAGQIGLLIDALRVSAQGAELLDGISPHSDALQVGSPGWFTGRRVGSYQLGVVAGSGAMGEVYEATHVSTGKAAAVKLLHPSTMQRSDLVCRFLREEMIMARLHGEHLVEVFEVADETSPLPYFAMELLRGEDLSRSLERRGRLSVAEAVRLAKEIGEGLDAAHGEGVIHRDLKPQNLFLDLSHDSWKILDFGVSRLISAGATLSQGEVVGTPPYMAPEQVLARDIDHRTDLFALGVILYRALTGRAPFGGSEISEIFHGIVNDSPARPSELAPIPEAFDTVLAIAMAKRPSDRFGSGAQFARVVEQAANGYVSGSLQRRAARLMERHPYPSSSAAQDLMATQGSIDSKSAATFPARGRN